EEDQANEHDGSDQRADGGDASDSAQRSHLTPTPLATAPAPRPPIDEARKPGTELNRELLHSLTHGGAGSCAMPCSAGAYACNRDGYSGSGCFSPGHVPVVR